MSPPRFPTTRDPWSPILLGGHLVTPFQARGVAPGAGRPMMLPPTTTGRSYWFAAADGRLFALASAGCCGSVSGQRPSGPITRISPSPNGRGYRLADSDGGVFTFGDAPHFGHVVYTSPAGQPVTSPACCSLVLPQNLVAVAELGILHHDHPGADITAGSGSDFYAITSHTITNLDESGGCGWGGQPDDGARYLYRRASARSVANSIRVAPGRFLGRSGGATTDPTASRGSAPGPHPRMQVKAQGSLRCPQPPLLALYNNIARAATNLYPSECTR